MTKETPVTVKELMQQLDNLKITSHQKEFIKAAVRTMLQAALEKRFGCKVSL